MWLASASMRDKVGRIWPASKWPDEVMDQVSASLGVLLEGVGDPEREREFRMCITLCRHRALSQEEHDGLPQWWHDAPAFDIAGGPVEVRWHKGIPEVQSAQPCVKPSREYIRWPDQWLPVDCGQCEPCKAREACHASPV